MTNDKRRHQSIRAVLILSFIVLLMLPVGCNPRPVKLDERVFRLLWVGYTPPSSNPIKGVEATPEAIREDLLALRKAGFNGLVTYGSSGVLGRELPGLAEATGFQGLILGIWDPANQDEISAAKSAARNPVVVGFCVGNEGLGERYQMSTLSAAIQNLRDATSKPVTTTEVFEKYSDERLLHLGDWAFPNAHPYFHSQLDAEAAARWTRSAYEDLVRRSDRPVILKEVGLPTAGDPSENLSEAAQARYYQELAKTEVRFVYFEAFDQPWKTDLPAEPHWGIFKADRTPKMCGLWLIDRAEGRISDQ